jgi:hypothetical protein
MDGGAWEGKGFPNIEIPPNRSVLHPLKQGTKETVLTFTYRKFGSQEVPAT